MTKNKKSKKYSKNIIRGVWTRKNEKFVIKGQLKELLYDLRNYMMDTFPGTKEAEKSFRFYEKLKKVVYQLKEW